MEMEETPKRKRNSAWVWVITIFLAGLFLFLAFRRVDWNELALTLRQGDLSKLALAVAILSLSCVMRGLRWRVLLSREKTLPVSTVFWATMTGYLGNSYLPARAGEVVRSMLIGQHGGISKSFSLATALTERLVDAVLLVGASGVALAVLATQSTLPLPAEFVRALQGMAIVGALGAVIVFIAPRASGLVQNMILRLPVSVGIHEKLGKMAENFLTGASALQNWGRLGMFLVYSAAIWTLDTLTGLTTASAFGLSLNAAHVFVLLAALGIASALPSTPGYVGVYQFVAVTVLVPFGLSEGQALAYIIGYQGVNYVVITLWGLIGLWKLRGALQFLRKSRNI
jgi:glycosyltransferase 2 family protein